MDADGKTKKRGLFGLGKKKFDNDQSQTTTQDNTSAGPTSTPQELPGFSGRQPAPAPVNVGSASQMTPSSPGRVGHPSSPRLSSPAGSQIFERNVQDSAVLPSLAAIPAHIQTENHIPPVLDASSEAITDDHLNPDTVEIVTHTHHQPAAAAVTGASMPPSQDSLAQPWAEDLAAFSSDKEELASNYGSLDSSDVRRLSFISFADVVQAEHGGLGGMPGNRESVHLGGLTSLASLGANRSPSPIRSPVSSQGPETSPPNSKTGSIKGFNMSPMRQPLGSPISPEHSIGGGDLNIETMSQALRRTGSTDLSQARGSIPVSPLESPSR
ncbi:uncharacterized protein B0I36DRAFT_248160 [Microdochium trichocladiopsis]|uniref:Uncharacterized protein n=1 Tax=Microdochium trichocladiopsis TaxID=1682393 RepID=A0A9P8Y0C4_9PEZI|nr:uncharacterized protein B0I36DRAFT_248160 [Microdochium trichocladiopsis]KAH7026403.1 hypothetical protein B0I36DRAFT_248160 [Microdochium trichocladiopsis]